MKYIDLFAGIGGFHQAAKQHGECVLFSEIDKFARRTYVMNEGQDYPAQMNTDIRELVDIPEFDYLFAGFPCQPFSKAGVISRASAGKESGFLDKTQGTLFFEIVRILEAYQPEGFILENVPALQTHDGGRTYNLIINTLTVLGYNVSVGTINAHHYVPQHRERLFFVGTRKPHSLDFDFPQERPTLRTILEENVDPKYTISDNGMRWMTEHLNKHKSQGHGYGMRIYGPDDVAGTLLARYYKDGKDILIRQTNQNPRKLTPRECARLMGFPDTFMQVVSDTQSYKQFGNAVVVPVVRQLLQAIL